MEQQQTHSSTTSVHHPKKTIAEDAVDSIRSFGCDRSETPAIFIHLGKAGGGNVGARFAAAALDYNRTNWMNLDDDHHYYPMRPTSTTTDSNHEIQRGRLCFGHYFHQPIPMNKPTEGDSYCNATDPLSMAIACPEPLQYTCQGCDAFVKEQQQQQHIDTTSKDDAQHLSYCHTVYIGHNKLGSEFHWLPPRYLQNWWQATARQNSMLPSSSSSSSSLLTEQVSTHLARLEPHDTQWCRGRGEEAGISRPVSNLKKGKKDIDSLKSDVHMSCMDTKAKEMGSVMTQLWSSRSKNHQNNYGALHASLPVQRFTILREPFSWMISKFFWHYYTRGNNCTRLDQKVMGSSHNWATDYLVNDYLSMFCGVDCHVRWQMGRVTLQEMEAQAITNLRQSISVVGIFPRFEEFYEMVSARVSYLDMSLNPHVKGRDHASAAKAGSGMARKIEECKRVYGDESFRDEFRRVVPAMVSAERVFAVAQEVNQFQQTELAKCKQSL